MKMDPTLMALASEDYERDYAVDLLAKSGVPVEAAESNVSFFEYLCEKGDYKKTWPDFHRYVETL